MKQKTQEDLGKDSIGKLLGKYALPCIASLLISALYNIVDQIYIGNSKVGYLGNTATNIIFPLTILALALALMFGDGAAANISLSQGRKDTASISKGVGNALLMSLIASALLTALCLIFLSPIISLMGASEASAPLAYGYGFYIIIGFPFAMLMNTMSGIIRADNSPRFAMAGMVIGAVLNIILDPLFINTFDMGVQGAAIATVIGEGVNFFIYLAYFFRSKSFRLKLMDFKPDFKLDGLILRLGLSSFLTQISIVIITTVSNATIAKYGAQTQYGTDIPLAVIGIVMKVFTIVINIGVGIAVGGQPIVGYNYGAKLYARVKKTYFYCIGLTSLVAIIATLLFEICPEYIIAIFGTQNDLYEEFALKTMRIYLAFIWATSLIKVSAIFLQSLGKAGSSAFLSLLRDVITFVPYTLILPIFFGLDGILYAAPAADLTSLLITFFIMLMTMKKLGIKDNENKLQEMNDSQLKAA